MGNTQQSMAREAREQAIARRTLYRRSFLRRSEGDDDASSCSSSDSGFCAVDAVWKHEMSYSTASDSEDDNGMIRFNDPVRENLMMLPSTLDPLGRKIRRITTEVVDSEEQLLLVKRRATAAKAVALVRDDSAKSKRAVPDAPPMTPQDFEYLKVIGVGGMGRVVLVRNRRDEKLYAMKVVSKRSVRENNWMDKVQSERDVLGGTHHDSLVHLRWAFQTKSSLFLVMDYCPGGELSSHLQNAERFTEEVALFYAAEVVLALEHLHRHGIIYRDLKPENILLTAEGHIKLVDFGLSKFGITEATAGANSICGSYEYVAPEVFSSRGYGIAVDWWSFGAVLYEMLTGLPPWYNENPNTMRKRVLTKPLSFPSHVSPDARDLLRTLLCRDPERRLGSRDGSLEIKRHAFFRSIDWQLITFREVVPPIRPCESEESIVNATNFDEEFTRLSIGSVDSVSNLCDEFMGFNFEAPVVSHIEYGYGRDIGARKTGVCA
ncbi:hypothetical protein Poli38472_003285 [Pythium oligandrum]|uniref:Uncharacterized protein n=1 Tax=Pythium oligandrum TaxID=41045 RepID=A0A8K1FBJ8_PYTOL|nr:hypothetical protein Poli38472_003285 [Pythium oligandrum]|eukprot:TMW57360.1 hypothetical protein Poli38472_003285 [Pythium oligandrum]